jgi:hypothetical protein
MHRGTLAALSFARSVSADVTAVMVDIEEQVTGRVQEKWERWGQDIPLVILHSPYRSLLQPLLSYLQQVDGRDPERGPAVVVLPEFVPAHGWQHLLHNQTALLIKAALLYSRADAGKDRVIIDIPYHLKE